MSQNETTAPASDGFSLPDYSDVAAKHERGKRLTALEFFVLENEPRGAAVFYWRQALAAAIREAIDDAAFAAGLNAAREAIDNGAK